MESRSSVFILVLLLGFSQAFKLDAPQPMDISSQILTTNNGSIELLVEGDILLATSRNSLVCPNNNCFWKKSLTGFVEVPFIVSIDFTSSDRNVIANAMATFHSKTCIRFVNRTVETDYLSIENKDGCFSAVGKTGGLQVVSLNRAGCLVQGIVQHELNHALGFYHEHTRSDRDSYVIINWENISPSMQYNFNRENTNNLNTLYDYSSVMHYGRRAFSMNGRDTITPTPNPFVDIGQRQNLSNIDIQRINILYKC
ncbi:hatching enzyme 1.2-like [Trichomycterus rosablanca]|uniref:hatching enzyme 1.2-like n=1 Tax=Trichomycterus rosablanca TaxID=2290929 RepID=UPI002F358BCA